MRTDHHVPRDIGPVPGGGAKILPFKRRVPERKRPQRPITDPLRRIEDEEDRRRMRENVAAALIIVLLVSVGFWLMGHLRDRPHFTWHRGRPTWLHAELAPRPGARTQQTHDAASPNRSG